MSPIHPLRSTKEEEDEERRSKPLRKGPPSCMECVRLKLKCTRSWPCDNCVRRGCSSLCPNGTMRPKDDLKMQKKVKALLKENEHLKAMLAAGHNHTLTPDADGEWEFDNPMSSTEAQRPVNMSSSSSSSNVLPTPPDLRAFSHSPDQHGIEHRRGSSSSEAHSSLMHSHSHSHSNAGPSPNIALNGQMVSPASQISSANTPPIHMPRTTHDGKALKPIREIADDPRHSIPPERKVASASGFGSGIMNWDWVEGDAQFCGRGAGAMYLVDEGEPSAERTGADALAGFPFASLDSSILSRFHEWLPSFDHAIRMLHVYFDRVEWMYTPTDRLSVEEVLETVYTSSQQGGLYSVAPHRLATFFIALALGSMFADSTSGLTYFDHHSCFAAACALLTLPSQHFMVRHSLASVEALHMSVSYLFSTHQPESARAAWPLLGVCIRTACAMGLHRDASKWGLKDVEAEKRQRLWWDCVTYDLLQSLNFGRPYSSPLHLSDAPPPTFAESLNPQTKRFPKSQSDYEFHDLKYRLMRRFVKVLDCLGAPELPGYDVVLRLDGELKAVAREAPGWLRWDESPSFREVAMDDKQGARAAQAHMSALMLHKALLALHRPWFFQAISTGSEPLRSPYAASFNACVFSARKHTQIMAGILRQCPTAAYRWWFFLFHAYTAAIIQAAVLLRLPHSMMSDDIRRDFQDSFRVIEGMSEKSGMAKRAMPMLRILKGRIEPVREPSATALSGRGLWTDRTHDQSAHGPPPLYGRPVGMGYTYQPSPPELLVPRPAGAAPPTQHPNPHPLPHSHPNPGSFSAPVINPESIIPDPAQFLTAEELPIQYQDPAAWAELDPLLQTLFHWNANNDAGMPIGVDQPVPGMATHFFPSVLAHGIPAQTQAVPLDSLILHGP